MPNDQVVGCFVYNYLSIEEHKGMAEVHRVLKNGGKFIFCVPPPFSLYKKKKTRPFFFDFGSTGYFQVETLKLGKFGDEMA